MPFIPNCERLVSVYAKKQDGDLLTIPFLVRCSNQGATGVTINAVTGTPITVLLCHDHANEVTDFIDYSDAISVHDLEAENDDYDEDEDGNFLIDYNDAKYGL